MFICNASAVPCVYPAAMAGCRKAREMRIASSLRMVRLPWSKHVFKYLQGRQRKRGEAVHGLLARCAPPDSHTQQLLPVEQRAGAAVLAGQLVVLQRILQSLGPAKHHQQVLEGSQV